MYSYLRLDLFIYHQNIDEILKFTILDTIAESCHFDYVHQQFCRWFLLYTRRTCDFVNCIQVEVKYVYPMISLWKVIKIFIIIISYLVHKDVRNYFSIASFQVGIYKLQYIYHIECKWRSTQKMLIGTDVKERDAFETCLRPRRCRSDHADFC